MAAITVYALSINGVDMPTPKRDGVIVTEEKVWSSNSGRTASGKMVGTIIAIKTTVQINWNGLTFEEAELIRSAVSDESTPFSVLSYTDIDGNTVEKTVYFGTPTFTINSTRRNGRVTSVSVTGIEQ